VPYLVVGHLFGVYENKDRRLVLAALDEAACGVSPGTRPAFGTGHVVDMQAGGIFHDVVRPSEFGADSKPVDGDVTGSECRPRVITRAEHASGILGDSV